MKPGTRPLGRVNPRAGFDNISSSIIATLVFQPGQLSLCLKFWCMMFFKIIIIIINILKSSKNIYKYMNLIFF
jgi:hypothetical protein